MCIRLSDYPQLSICHVIFGSAWHWGCAVEAQQHQQQHQQQQEVRLPNPKILEFCGLRFFAKHTASSNQPFVDHEWETIGCLQVRPVARPRERGCLDRNTCRVVRKQQLLHLHGSSWDFSFLDLGFLESVWNLRRTHLYILYIYTVIYTYRKNTCTYIQIQMSNSQRDMHTTQIDQIEYLCASILKSKIRLSGQLETTIFSHASAVARVREYGTKARSDSPSGKKTEKVPFVKTAGKLRVFFGKTLNC